MKSINVYRWVNTDTYSNITDPGNTTGHWVFDILYSTTEKAYIISGLGKTNGITNNIAIQLISKAIDDKLEEGKSMLYEIN